MMMSIRGRRPARARQRPSGPSTSQAAISDVPFTNKSIRFDLLVAGVDASNINITSIYSMPSPPPAECQARPPNAKSHRFHSFCAHACMVCSGFN